MALNVLSRIGPDSVQKVQDVSYNGIQVSWTSTNGPVQLKIAVRCLSTDFSNQKGVKGIPLYLQIDTYERGVLKDRAVAQIKVFGDKGADRKLRDEERRLARQPMPYPCQQSKTHTVFSHTVNLMIEPILYGPKTVKQEPLDQSTELHGIKPLPPAAPVVFHQQAAIQPQPFNSNTARMIKKAGRNVAPVTPPPLFLYVRQENEEIFTPLCLSQPPTLDQMILAISSKYQIEVGDIRHVYKRIQNGAIIHVDSDFVVGLAGSFFLMKVLVVEGTGPSLNTYDNLQVGFNQRTIYDIVLCEMARPQK